MLAIYSPNALLALITAVAAAGLSIALVIRDSASRENLLVAAVMAVCVPWSLCEYAWTQTPGAARALLFARAANVGPLLIGPIVVELIAALQPRLRENLRGWMPYAWAVWGVAIAISLFSPFVVVEMTKTSAGWMPDLHPAAGFVYIAVNAFPLAAAWEWRRLDRSNHPTPASRSLWVEITFGIPLLTSAATNFLLPTLGIHVPRLGAACAVGWGGLIWWSVMGSRHRSLAPHEFAIEIFEALPDGVILLRVDGRIRSANGTMGGLCGCLPEQLKGRPIDQLLSKPPGVDGQERECELLRECGERIPVSVRTATLRDEQANPVGSVLVVRDVREVVSLRSKLLTSGRLAAVGQLAAGIAHEINNPIAYVRSNLGLLRQHWDAVRTEIEKTRRGPLLESVLDDGDELIHETAEGVERVAAIVRDVGGFGRTGGSDLEFADIHELLDTAVRVAAPQLRGRVDIERQYAELPPIEVRGRELMQVFVNLLLNAAQAIEGSGSIALTTESTDEAIVIAVEDDGPGIDGEQLERIFEPFFTTKPVGVGTGLGLAISHQIIESHRGELRVTSEPGRGTRFEISLPRLPRGPLEAGG